MIESLYQRIRQFREHLKFKYMPRLAEWAVWAASINSMPKLQAMKPIKLLLDSNIHAHAVTHEDAWIDTGTVLWGGVQPIETGYAARIPVHSTENKSREYKDICHLTVITRLVRKGVFELYTSSELMSERDRHPPARFDNVTYSGFSLLDGLKVESLDGWNFDAYVMHGLSTDVLQRAQSARLKGSDDRLYEAILKTLGGEAHSQDAWHIRTAQVHGMYAFVTMDYKLVRLATAQRERLIKLGAEVQILTPSQLAKQLSLGEVPPYLFSHNNASFPVRADLHWPDERRRRTVRRSHRDRRS